MADSHYATLMETADAIRSRKISPTELTSALLERIARLDPMLHSFATVTAELACEQARWAEAELAHGVDRGPLHGIPLGGKDIINTAAVVTAGGGAVHCAQRPRLRPR